MATMDIPNILQKSTSLSADQIRSVLKNPSVLRPVSIGEALSHKEYTSAEELVSELCKEMGVDFIKDIPIGDISADLVRDIPINYAKQNSVLPYKEELEQVTVLSSNPLNLKALDDLRVLFGKKIRPLVTTNAKIQDAINRVYEKSTANLT
ncbi:MAG: type II secretion system protein GspE, partial [Proteobacteria bacterium]